MSSIAGLRSPKSKGRKNNKSIQKRKHFLEEFTKKIVLGIITVTATQTFTY